MPAMIELTDFQNEHFVAHLTGTVSMAVELSACRAGIDVPHYAFVAFSPDGELRLVTNATGDAAAAALRAAAGRVEGGAP